MRTNFSAYARQAWRKASGDISRFFDPRSRSTFSSIGSPWQSQPGRYGASFPVADRLRTITSFRILLSTVPRWMCPLA